MRSSKLGKGGILLFVVGFSPFTTLTWPVRLKVLGNAALSKGEKTNRSANIQQNFNDANYQEAVNMLRGPDDLTTRLFWDVTEGG